MDHQLGSDHVEGKLSRTISANQGFSFTNPPDGFNNAPTFLVAKRTEAKRSMNTPAAANYDLPPINDSWDIQFPRKARLDYPLQPEGIDAPGVGHYLSLEDTSTIRKNPVAKGRPENFNRRMRSTFFRSSTCLTLQN
jgi:hypothetical protein